MKRKLLILLLALGVLGFSSTTVNSRTLSAYNFSFEVSQNGALEELWSFTIYPNPATNKFRITTKQPLQDAQVAVFDILGKQVYVNTLNSINTTIDISKWKSGVYLVKVTSNKVSQTKRFIKQ